MKKTNDAEIAQEKEVLALFTSIMRGELGDEKPKLADRVKAAEMLGKHYGTFDDKRGSKPGTQTAIVKKINAAMRELMSRDQA